LACRTPGTGRRRYYEIFQRTPIYLSAGVSGGSGGTGSAVGDGRTLAAASGAARDDALLFVLLQRAHICIVVVSIVSTTVPDVVFNT
jgi:F0F1-type ATP synthase membrane subunit c/vacuolar-type H+-ATPase subunit K